MHTSDGLEIMQLRDLDEMTNTFHGQTPVVVETERKGGDWKDLDKAIHNLIELTDGGLDWEERRKNILDLISIIGQCWDNVNSDDGQIFYITKVKRDHWGRVVIQAGK